MAVRAPRRHPKRSWALVPHAYFLLYRKSGARCQVPNFPLPDFLPLFSPPRLLPFAPCQLRRPLRIRRPVLERSCCRAPFPAFRAVPVCPLLGEPASAEFRPLGVWRSARVLRAQAAARPEDRPECLKREPAAVSFWPGPGPARAKTARGPAEFPQGAFRRKPAPSVTDRSRLQALLRILACPAGQTLRVEPDPGTMLCGPLGGPAYPLMRDGPQRNASGVSPSQSG